MSRIHDALRKAEEERKSVGQDDEPSLLAEDALLCEDPFALALEVEAELPPHRAALSNRVASLSLPSHPTKDLRLNGLTPECAEEFRTLRTRLNQARAARPLKRLLVSSPLPGEGKTFMAGRLAQILAQKDSPVLLVDGDLRCGGLHEQMGVPVAPGVTDFLKGTHSERDVIHPSAHEGLFVIPAGEPVSQSAELLASGRVIRLLDAISGTFDWVIVDSPAATIISDASVLADACDGVILVIEAGRTPFDLAQKAKMGFQRTPVVGAVLNRSANSSKSYYGHYQRSV